MKNAPKKFLPSSKIYFAPHRPPTKRALGMLTPGDVFYKLLQVPRARVVCSAIEKVLLPNDTETATLEHVSYLYNFCFARTRTAGLLRGVRVTPGTWEGTLEARKRLGEHFCASHERISAFAILSEFCIFCSPRHCALRKRVNRARDSATERPARILYGTIRFSTQLATVLENGLRELGMSLNAKSA